MRRRCDSFTPGRRPPAAAALPAHALSATARTAKVGRAAVAAALAADARLADRLACAQAPPLPDDVRRGALDLAPQEELRSPTPSPARSLASPGDLQTTDSEPPGPWGLTSAQMARLLGALDQRSQKVADLTEARLAAALEDRVAAAVDELLHRVDSALEERCAAGLRELRRQMDDALEQRLPRPEVPLYSVHLAAYPPDCAQEALDSTSATATVASGWLAGSSTSASGSPECAEFGPCGVHQAMAEEEALQASVLSRWEASVADLEALLTARWQASEEALRGSLAQRLEAHNALESEAQALLQEQRRVQGQLAEVEALVSQCRGAAEREAALLQGELARHHEFVQGLAATSEAERVQMRAHLGRYQAFAEEVGDRIGGLATIAADALAPGGGGRLKEAGDCAPSLP